MCDGWQICVSLVAIAVVSVSLVESSLTVLGCALLGFRSMIRHAACSELFLDTECSVPFPAGDVLTSRIENHPEIIRCVRLQATGVSGVGCPVLILYVSMN